MGDGLFPAVPTKLEELSDKELADLLADHEQAAGLIDAEDTEFLAGLTADEIITQYESGASAIKLLRAEMKARDDAAEAYAARKEEIASGLKAESEGEGDGDGEGDAEGDTEGDGEGDGEDAEAEGEGTAESDEVEAEADKVEVKAEKVLVADAEAEKPRLRRVPPASAERIVVSEESALSFVASGLVPSTTPGSALRTRGELATASKRMMDALGPPAKSADGREDRYRVATLDYKSNFPAERTLVASDLAGNADKIAAIGSPFLGAESLGALVASGGLCAPLEPIYTMPQFAVRDRPVRDALPNFRAERGGVNVPTPTTIGDAAGAITVISAAADGLGGTFATKSCLDMDCPTYTEYAVTVISHCREFGNLNAMAWPEKIAHENDLTMAEHARVAETYLLDQIKALSVNVTQGADTLGAMIYLVDAIVKAKHGIRSRLRMPREARFVALLPAVIEEILELDTVSTQFDRFQSIGDLNAYLAGLGIDAYYYLDSPSTGTSQIADASQTAGTLDGLPANIQWAVFPQGTFIHIDMAELNLGIVRDSTLNSTNDFQNFGETFENIAKIGPDQAAYWVTSNICPTGQFPGAGTVRSCE